MSTLVDGLFMLQSHAHFQLMAHSPSPTYSTFFDVQVVWGLALFSPNF
jgi:hypothetical protein